MTDRQDTGQAGEEEAAKYLRKKGYEIIEQNFRAGQLELDLIAKDEDCLVFVEVRVRADTAFGYPEQSLSKGKINAVKRAAEAYLRKTNWQGDIRFDFIAIVLQPTLELLHFEDVFF